MIERIDLCQHHIHRLHGMKALEFGSGFSALIGPNGSGKSTVLRALQHCRQCETHISGAGAIHYFDAERMNPHAPAGPPGSLRNMMLRTRGLFSSHGQIMRAALAALPVHAEDTLLLDEPEAGQDLAGVERLWSNLMELTAQGCQIIIATHHPFFLRGAHILELTPGYASTLRDGFLKGLRELGAAWDPTGGV